MIRKLQKDHTSALRKAGFAGVCLYNGKYRWGDGRELSLEDQARVLKIVQSVGVPPTADIGSAGAAAPTAEDPHKNKGGRPKGAKDTYQRTRGH